MAEGRGGGGGEWPTPMNLMRTVEPDDTRPVPRDIDPVVVPNLNVVNLKQPPNEIEAAGDSLRRNEQTLVANANIVARLRRAHYLAYIEAGFSKEEALTLCTK